MQSKKPLLTIAVPTYNRSAFLKQLLDVLAPQIANEPQVELLISDNASPDDTPEVVESFRKKGLKVIYQRNVTNIGSDANFLQCYNMARGDFAWIFGDDDVIVDGGLRQVVRVLEKYECDLVAVSSYPFRDSFVPPDGSRLKGKVVVFSNAVNYALRTSTYLAFISGNIIRKTTLEAKPHRDFSELIGTNLIHLSWTYTLLSRNPKCILIRDRIVAIRTENTGGYGTCQVFGRNIKQMIRVILEEESKLGRALLNKNLQHFLPWAVVEDRSGKSVNNFPEDTEGILRDLFGGNFRFWLFLWPALKLPLPLAKMWSFLVRVTNRADRILGHPIAR